MLSVYSHTEQSNIVCPFWRMVNLPSSLKKPDTLFIKEYAAHSPQLEKRLVNLFLSLLEGWLEGWLSLWGHKYTTPGHCFFPVFLKLWLLQLFSTLSSVVLALWERTDVNAIFVAEYSVDRYSLHFDQLGVLILATLHWTQELSD